MPHDHDTYDENTNNQKPYVEEATDSDDDNAQNPNEEDPIDSDNDEPSEDDGTDSDDDENNPLMPRDERARRIAAAFGNIPWMNFFDGDLIAMLAAVKRYWLELPKSLIPEWKQIAVLFRMFPWMNSLGENLSAMMLAAVKRYLLELPKQLYKEIKIWKEKNPKKFWTIVICSLLGISLPITATLIGFTSGGIAAGSLAAIIHAGIGNVAAGSFFAFMQSITATGLLTALGVGFAGAAPALWAFIEGLKEGGWVRNFCSWINATGGAWARRFFCWITGKNE